jgi:hypothetical protein
VKSILPNFCHYHHYQRPFKMALRRISKKRNDKILTNESQFNKSKGKGAFEP